jgi:hypothetical protein
MECLAGNDAGTTGKGDDSAYRRDSAWNSEILKAARSLTIDED